VHNSDHFVNLHEVKVFHWSTLEGTRAHGLLGQTWQRPSRGSDRRGVIEGDVDDYTEASNDLLGGSFAFQRGIVRGTEAV
jgi:hypothetical protein